MSTCPPYRATGLLIFGKTPARVRDALDQASTIGGKPVDLHEVRRDIAGERGEINRRKDGWWVKRPAGRIVEGLRFVRVGAAEVWRVESVSRVLLVSGPPIRKNVGDMDYPDHAYARASCGEQF